VLDSVLLPDREVEDDWKRLGRALMGHSWAACWAALAGLRERGKRGRELGCSTNREGFLRSLFKFCFQICIQLLLLFEFSLKIQTF
jgi:hypothetical protein